MRRRLDVKRLLLKVSGEVLGGKEVSVNFNRVERFAGELKSAYDTGTEVAVVVGGGNIVRGYGMSRQGVERVTGDNMGMLGTIINALALQSSLEKLGVETRVMTAIAMDEFAEPYIRRRALNHLEKGRFVILAGGTGNPFFTTDTAAALRAAEIKADALFKGTKVDGIYSSDPVTNPDAEMIAELSYLDVLKDEIGVMDATAVTLCKENNIPIIVFNFVKEGNLKRLLEGENLGTIVC
ncbi:MAG: UMP kinase [Candidatus Krumholzibacteria bacterium]|nr:UMP kinase [Candidatus Krumholzibacteria bacterium]